MKSARNARHHDFLWFGENRATGPGPFDSMSDPKPCAIGHENGQKYPKSRVFYDFVKIVWWGPGPYKSTSNPKTVCYSARKWLQMPEITSFLWFRENRVTGPGPYKSTSDPKTVCYSPRKRPEMPEIMKFSMISRKSYDGSWTIQIHVRPQNRVL